MDPSVKKSIIGNVLKEWYAVDSILFNDYARRVIREGNVFKEYVSLKAGMLSNVFEYYMFVGVDPSNNHRPDSIIALQECAILEARKCKKLAVDLISKESTQLKIKERVLNEANRLGIRDLEDLSDRIIEEKLFQYAIDNALIGLPLLEAKKLDVDCNTFKCKMLEEAYKTFRDSLVQLALTCKRK